MRQPLERLVDDLDCRAGGAGEGEGRLVDCTVVRGGEGEGRVRVR